MKTVYSLEIEEIRELELNESSAVASCGNGTETLYANELRGKNAMDSFSQRRFSPRFSQPDGKIGKESLWQPRANLRAGAPTGGPELEQEPRIYDSGSGEKHQEQNQDESEAKIGRPRVTPPKGTNLRAGISTERREISPPGESEFKSGGAQESARKYVCISLEEIECFEVVKDQFRDLGVQFINAIAIQPSNPAFGTPAGVKVLMGAPKTGSIEVTFTNPVKWVSALVTSSRRTTLSACDRENQEVARDEMPAANLAGFSNSTIPPNAPLKVQAPAIYKAIFYAFDGQLVIKDFSFGF